MCMNLEDTLILVVILRLPSLRYYSVLAIREYYFCSETYIAMPYLIKYTNPAQMENKCLQYGYSFPERVNSM